MIYWALLGSLLTTVWIVERTAQRFFDMQEKVAARRNDEFLAEMGRMRNDIYAIRAELRKAGIIPDPLERIIP